MTTSLSVIALPDLFALGEDTVLKAALYFDSIYADSFLPELQSIQSASKKSRSNLTFSLTSQLKNFNSLTELIEAGVIIPVTFESTIPLKSFSSRSLPVSLRHKVAKSMKESADLLSHFITSNLQKSTGTKSFIIEDPSKLDNSMVEMAICLHIVCISTMLGICADGKASPLVSSAVHMELLSGLAKNFPSVAQALGVKEAASLIPKQNALAIRILEETLPSIEVRNAVDILYLRDELRDELIAFRAEIGKLSTMIESEPWESKFQREVQTVVAKEVTHSLTELRRRLQHPSKRMLSHLVADWKSIATSAAIPVTAYVMTNSSLPLSILAGLATGLSIAALKTKIEEWSIKKESSLTFLMEASKRLER